MRLIQTITILQHCPTRNFLNVTLLIIVDDIRDNFNLIEEKNLRFEKAEADQKLGDMDEIELAQSFAKTKSVSMVSEGEDILFFFSTKPIKIDPKSKLEYDAEIVYITKLIVGPEEVTAEISIIDRVFEVGIFKKSKIFHIGPSVFLISLHEEIIVVKHHFDRYVVWDNVSLAPNKSNDKKGQLVLAD